MNAKGKNQQQRRTNICLGTDHLPLVTSYYKDYVEGKDVYDMKNAKATIATPPETAQIGNCSSFQILPEGSLPPPDATTNRLDFTHPGINQCTAVYKSRLADLSSNRNTLQRNSVIFGPCAETDPFQSCAMSAYKHPLENQRIMMQRYEEMEILGSQKLPF
ncbi:uncharacterized protein LOC117117128 [Anneissia japonica]|uniref:uncharacterized protein LOC117117128 n=1 Tax=Anneissia japonica TaxID=1529436 RepID=UPI0014256D46|nr:uncharacterized protein LOC117117128 [Anneissia japonica]